MVMAMASELGITVKVSGWPSNI